MCLSDAGYILQPSLNIFKTLKKKETTIKHSFNEDIAKLSGFLMCSVCSDFFRTYQQLLLKCPFVV